ncbi:hypothetical protein ML462_15630 [Gramella lutea]|uniref:Uncharacterized protein n=1 Tax=Christiangramia lutea TaxID=1607951 RepID=A0A9X2AAC9_9FLAO|nr:hypothetical protein [Christiangramia lutea]MCH4824604.1 hypothetical protein [Christiangramia lutea]
MRKEFYFLILGIIIVFIILKFNIPTSDSNIVGTYVLINNENKNFAEIPSNKDTLILNPDKTFNSGYYGNGKYEIENNFLNTKILLHYNYEFGTASYKAKIENKLFEEIKINLNDDLEITYNKVY